MNDDAYLAHAAEDKAFASQLAEALRQRGLRVWFNDFIVGPSIREQMERGLVAADFGVVVLSPRFFAKKWTGHELDAMLGLEEPGDVRILPVWFEVSHEQVRFHSPMLAMRSAAVFEGDLSVVADALLKSICSISSRKSQAKSRRFEIATGFSWSVGPVFMSVSLAKYDERFEDYGIVGLAYYPEIAHAGQDSTPVPLGEILRAYTLWDGRDITVVGKQRLGSVQVFDEIVRPEDVPGDVPWPPDAGVVAYVFQLTSMDFTNGELCYVHCIGPYDRESPGWGPHTPDPDWLCWVTGMLVAYGVMPNDRGRRVNTLYLVARAIQFTPPVANDSTSAG